MTADETIEAALTDEPTVASADEATAATSPPEESSGPTFQQLDTRAIGLWRQVAMIAFAIIGGIALIVGSILMWTLGFPVRLGVVITWLVLGVWAAISIVWWPRWDYNRWAYRLGTKVVELRYGVVWHVSVSIPMSRLQHIDIHRGPLERRRGLASLEIHTAGTRDASHRIPGLDAKVAGQLRDQLIDASNRGSHGQHKR